ncbi:MAG: co-chaperone YbbN [Vibrionaceae bacterium]
MQNSYIIELDSQNISSVLESSLTTPVMFYFWAEAEPDSVTLKQILTNIANGYNGLLTLATLDCQQQPMLARQFGLQVLPTIALFSQGQPVDGLTGLQTEETVRAMLQNYLPNSDEIALNQAVTLIEQGEFAKALQELKVLDEKLGKVAAYKLALAECYIETKQFDLAQKLLATILLQDQDANFKRLLAKVELHLQAADSDEIRDLQQQVAQNPGDLALEYQLALAFNQAEQAERALELLLAILRRDLDFAQGDAKKTTMNILASLGQGNELASRYRRKLYALLY